MGLATKNNNPGNLKDPQTGSFHKFNSPEDGYVALMNDLQGKVSGASSTGLNGNSTLFDFAKTYAPESDKNNPAQYTVDLANRLKINPDTKLSDLQGRIPEFAFAIAHNEDKDFASQYPLKTTPPTENPSFLEQLGKVYSPQSMVSDIEKYGPTAAPAAALAVGAGPALGIAGGLLGKGAGLVKGALTTLGIQKGIDTAKQAAGIGGETSGLPNQPGSNAGGQSDILQELNQYNSGTGQSAAASNAVKDALLQQLSTTRPNREFVGSPQGQSGVQTASTYGYAPDVNENGIVDTSSAMSKLRKNQENLVDLEKKFAGEGTASPLTAANFAGKYIEGDKSLTPQEREQVGSLARKEIMSYGSANRPMSIQGMIDARHQQYAATKGKYGVGKTSVQIAAHKAAAYGFREAVRSSTPEPKLYDAILKEEQNHINAEKLLKRVHNTKALQNNATWRQFLRGSARYAEIYIGDKLGGPLGAVLGGMAGEHLNRAIDKRLGKTIFETKGMRAAMDTLKDTKPEMYRHIIEELHKYDIHPDLKEPGESPKVPSSRIGIREDIEKNIKAMESKKGLIKRPTALYMKPPVK